MDEIKLQKQQIRAEYKKKRTLLSRDEVLEKSFLINKNFIENLLPKIYQKNSDPIFSLYFANYNEVECTYIAKYFLENKIKFCYPKIVDLNAPLEFILNSDENIFVENKFFPKILEIKNGQKITPNFLILPVVAFDENLMRMGMGGGFFDRTIGFFNSQGLQITTIGLSYELLRYSVDLPCEKTDLSLDFIVSEGSIYSSNRAIK